MTRPLPFLFFPYTLLHTGFRELRSCFSDKVFQKSLFLSTLSWLMVGLCTPPLPGGLLVFVALVPWLLSLDKLSVGRAALVSFLSGLPYNVLMYYWIYNTLPRIAVPPWQILAGMTLLFAFFSLFNTVLGLGYRLSRGSLLLRCSWPLAWAGLEVLRSTGDMSFPWGHLAYTLGNFQTLLQGLSLIGVFLYSAFIIATNMTFAHAWKKRKIVVLLPITLVLASLWVYGAYVLAHQKHSSETADIALIQPAIEQMQKWEKGYYEKIVEKTTRLAEDPRNKGARWIVIPETAIPDFLRVKREYSLFQKKAHDIGSDILIGALDFDKKGPKARKGYRYFNSAYLFSADGSRVKSYRKIMLVPFSERLPFEDIFPIISFVDLGEGDFSPGENLLLLDSNIRATPQICYESIYPAFVRRAVREGARIILNITNDGWFGRSTAPYQHVNLVKFRAIENAMPVARAANSGVSLFIDSYGNTFQATDLYVEAIIRHKLPLRSRVTFYTRIGDLLEPLLLGIFILHMFFAIFRYLRLRSKSDLSLPHASV